jgi:hypothetical protein
MTKETLKTHSCTSLQKKNGLSDRPNRIPILERFPARYAVNCIPSGGINSQPLGKRQNASKTDKGKGKRGPPECSSGTDKGWKDNLADIAFFGLDNTDKQHPHPYDPPGWG